MPISRLLLPIAYPRATLLPIAVYRGLNSTCCDGTTQMFIDKVERILPDVYIHSIKFNDNPEIDRLRSIFDEASSQVKSVCDQLEADPKLSKGFNAVGLSQGGVLMRAYVEYCNDPPVHNLITLGSPHAGIIDFPSCKQERLKRLAKDFVNSIIPILSIFPDRLICMALQEAIRESIYSTFFQQLILSAQYFINNDESRTYEETRPFIADINNQLEPRNETYKKHLISLQHFVVHRFEDDQLIVPSSSAWFILNGNKSDSGDEKIYREDWIGLKELDESGRLIRRSIPGQHLELLHNFIRNELIEYLNITVK